MERVVSCCVRQVKDEDATDDDATDDDELAPKGARGERAALLAGQQVLVSKPTGPPWRATVKASQWLQSEAEWTYRLNATSSSLLQFTVLLPYGYQ